MKGFDHIFQFFRWKSPSANEQILIDRMDVEYRTLAMNLQTIPLNDETREALRKLLESRHAAIRAILSNQRDERLDFPEEETK